MATAHEGSDFCFKVYKECNADTDGAAKVYLYRGIYWKEHITLYKFGNAFISEELSRIISTICPSDSSLSFYDTFGHAVKLEIRGKHVPIHTIDIYPEMLSDKKVLQQVYDMALEWRPEFKKTDIDGTVVNYKNLVTVNAHMPKSTLEAKVGEGFINKTNTDETRGGAASQRELLETPEARNAMFLKISAIGEINEVVELEGKIGDALTSLGYKSNIYWSGENPRWMKG